MINKAFKEYMEKSNNIDFNYNKIISNKKGVYSLKYTKKKILNIAAILLIVVIVGVTSPQIYAKIKWNIQFNEYKNRQVEGTKGSLETAKEGGYAEIIDMDYVTQNGISAKIDSILVTDNCLDANVSFKFNDDIVLNSETFGFGYAVYDENKNVYQVFSRMHLGENEKNDYTSLFIYKDIGIDFDKKDIYNIQLSDRGGLNNVEASSDNKTITSNFTIRARKTFPKSKKLYIRIFDLGYSMVDTESKSAEDFPVSNAEWIFEINVPDKFYENQSILLKPKTDIPGIKFEKISINETGMSILFNSEEYIKLISDGFIEATKTKFSITDGENHTYQDLGGGTTENANEYKMLLDAGKKDLAKTLYVNYVSNGVQYKVELIKE